MGKVKFPYPSLGGQPGGLARRQMAEFVGHIGLHIQVGGFNHQPISVTHLVHQVISTTCIAHKDQFGARH